MGNLRREQKRLATKTSSKGKRGSTVLKGHQLAKADLCDDLLRKFGVAYLVGEMRTGKTLTAFETVRLHFGDQCKVVFLTAANAVKGIEKQYKDSSYKFELKVSSISSVHKLARYDPDFLIIDEAHKLGTFPKPNKSAKKVRKMFSGLPTLLMSGTPSPESFSQLYHQLWVTGRGVWSEYKNFYRWADDHVRKTTKYIGLDKAAMDYSKALPIVEEEFSQIKVTLTQKEAGIKYAINEEIFVITSKRLLKLINGIKADSYFKKGKIVVDADSAAKKHSTMHQLCSGTVIDDEGVAHIVDPFKANFIKDKFNGNKIAIFYLFKKEGELLKKTFKNFTEDDEEFNKSKNKVYIRQVVSGREGQDLRTADWVIFFNIPYSSVSYQQARERSVSMFTKQANVAFIINPQGIDPKVYEVVKEKKKSFTVKHYIQWEN